MSLSKSKCWYSNNCLHLLNHAVALEIYGSIDSCFPALVSNMRSSIEIYLHWCFSCHGWPTSSRAGETHLESSACFRSRIPAWTWNLFTFWPIVYVYRDQYHKTLRIHNLQKIDRFCGKVVSFGLDKPTSLSKQDTSLLRSPYIMNLSCFYDTPVSLILKIDHNCQNAWGNAS